MKTDSKIHYYDVTGERDYLANSDLEKSITEATEEEVLKMLKAEAIKRGYKKGNFKCLILPSPFEDSLGTELDFDNAGGRLFMGGQCVFNHGKWATLSKETPSYTMEELQDKVGFEFKLIK